MRHGDAESDPRSLTDFKFYLNYEERSREGFTTTDWRVSDATFKITIPFSVDIYMSVATCTTWSIALG
jgi:hypothetical protein